MVSEKYTTKKCIERWRWVGREGESEERKGER